MRFAAAAAGVATILAVLAWLVTWVGTSMACAWDTSVCAEGHGEYEEYRGRFLDSQGRPIGELHPEFSSDLFGLDWRQPIATDDTARFCVRSPASDGPAFISPASLVERAHGFALPAPTGPVDPRFLDRARLKRAGIDPPPLPDGIPYAVIEPGAPAAQTSTAAGTSGWEYFPGIHPVGAVDATALWDPSTDRSEDCQELDAEPSWFKFKDSQTSWQFLTLSLLALLSVAFLLAGAALRRRGRDPRGVVRLRLLTIGSGALTIAWAAALWFLL